ncbi:MAG: hypothetical protein O9269_11030 [Brevundimonas sp.]|nr:hypothetical protein [Brevundimonas sp.]MCZ8195037.1 hypothetical protein [Brevundimonas sp.]
MRHLYALSLGLGFDDRQPPAGAPILAHFDAAIDLDPRVQLCVQDAIGPLGRSPDRGSIPQPARGRGNPIAIERVGDVAAGQQVDRVHPEDPADDGGFFLDNGQGSAGLGAVAIESASGREALLGVRGHAAPRLLAQVADIVLGDQPLERHVHVEDAVGRERRDRGADVGEPIGDVGQVLKIAGEAVLVFSQQQIELVPIGGVECSQKAGAVGHGRARDRRVGVDAYNRPALVGGVTGQHRQLVGDRPLILTIGRVAGVEGDAGHRVSIGPSRRRGSD